jgi:hypothetical protein
VRSLITNRMILLMAIVCLFTLTVSGCYRERPSDKTPIHFVPDMDSQLKNKPQSKSDFFEDGSSMRLPVEGTVARGQLKEDDAYYLGKDSRGKFIRNNPIQLDESSLNRGQERFDIYCSMCHGRVGDGMGIVVEKGLTPPPSFHIDRIRNMPDGEIFDIISNGIRNMPSYKHQVPVNDRWAIIHFLRTLQRSQNALLSDIPLDMRDKLE